MPAETELGPPALAEQLTRQFYAWERRGRGWDVTDHPTTVEPPYAPFVRFASAITVPDDGIRHSFWSALFAPKKAPAGYDFYDSDLSEQDFPLAEEKPYSEIQVALPPDAKVANVTEQFLRSL